MTEPTPLPNSAAGCPDPQTLVQALSDVPAPGLLDHVSGCPLCVANPALQEVLEIWRQLDSLEPIVVSDKFEARLQALIVTREKRQRRWQWLDLCFDWLHVPVLAALIGLLFWLPPPLQSASSQRLEREVFTTRPQPRQDLSAADTLLHLRQLYQQRRNQG